MAALTNKEQAILNIYIHSEQSLIGAEIADRHPDLNINTIQSVLRSLLKKGYIEVAEIVYSGTVLCRSYKATEEAREMVLRNFSSHFHGLRRNTPMPQIFAALVGDDANEQEVIDALEKMIKEKRENEQK